ncbi:GAF domain-containing protein [Sphingomicrobium lutaoense]|uniref:histidine kinase n=1 Tax=Sphingomicrobium lutaoense TaxID=515949 RepID=A0A839YWX7_9SPHN|nr:GAF domain-containing protein [Sphingomicrobium lutaoense]MBB3762990.1 PAS domain S-box-containing protein [Sphingomicrobium lutaoense]
MNKFDSEKQVRGAVEDAASQALRQSEARLRLVQEIGGIGGFDYDIERDEATCTDKFYEMAGLDREGKVSLQSWADVIHPDDREKVVAKIRDAIEQRKTIDQTYRIIRPDNGETRWLKVQSAVVEDKDGGGDRYVGGVIDITRRKEIERELRDTSQRLDAILNNTQMAIFMMDDRQHCVFMNRAAEELTGYRFAETVGRPLHDVIHNQYPDGSHYPLEECPIDRAFPERNQMKGEEIFVHKDGHFYPVAFTASPIRDQDGNPIGTVIEAQNIAQSQREEFLRAAQNRVLELAISDRPIEEPLSELIAAIEKCSDHGLIGSILLLDDDGRLHHGGAHSLPQSYIGAIDGITIGPDVGSCGTAAFHKEEVHVSDIANDERWKDFRETALSHGLRACWSIPILSGKNDVLGTFALYYPQAMDAPPADLELVEFITRPASLVIERARSQQALQEKARTLATINKVGASLAAQFDLERIIQMVTDSGTELSGAAFGAFFYNVEDEGESYMLYTLSGVDRSEFENFPMPRATKVFAPTFKGEGVVRSADITTDPRYGKNSPYKGMPEGHLPVRSYLAVPVASRTGAIIGGLFFGHPEPNMFSAEHEAVLVGLAGQAAIAIDNAHLFEAAQREVKRSREAEDAVRDLNANLEVRIENAIAEREAAEDALRQAQKMEAVGQLTGGIAHDFNNLLTIISGNIDMAQRAFGENAPPKVSRALDNAMIGAERAATLTQRLLAFSRRQPLDPKLIDANRLVKDMSKLLQRTLGETIEIETDLAADLGPVEVDPIQLESAIINLAVNARDAIFEKNDAGIGTLTITTRNVDLDKELSSANMDAPPGEYACIQICDDGIGMDADQLQRAFEPFFTTKEVGKGTGLGLSMVYGFVRQSGGHISIDSTRGEGTTIAIHLPRTVRTTREDERISEPESDKLVHDGTILVCEDDDDVRAYTVDLLRDLGYRVLEAHDGESAIRLLERQPEEIDLLFTDVILPGGMTGAAVAERAREIQAGIKVLFTTGYARDVIVHDGRLDEGVELLPKPFSNSQLAVRVHEIIKRKAD